MQPGLPDFILLAFTSLFTMVNPLGTIPVYTSMTSNLSSAEARKVAFKAVLIATITLFLFAFAGKFIFNFFAISVNSLKVVGGIIFFMAGFDMLQARLIRTKQDNENSGDFVNDIAITPLAIPIICGPGAMTVSIVLYNEAVHWEEKLVLFGAILIVMMITLLFLLSGRKIISFVGENGNKVLMRIMGLIVMVIAVEFLFSGLKPILQDIFLQGK